MRVSVSVVGRRRVYVELKARDLTFLPFNLRVAEDLSFRAFRRVGLRPGTVHLRGVGYR